MTLAMQDCLWSILETEAFERYFINDAEKPAFLILHKYNPLTHGSFELFMNNVARLRRFKTHKEAIEKHHAKAGIKCDCIDEVGRPA